MGDIVVSAFITPPSLKELEKRLTSRSTDDIETINRRLENAKTEIKALSEYDFVIINDNIDEAKDKFISIANSARAKWSKQKLDTFIDKWLD
jgi:guanylate kinase